MKQFKTYINETLVCSHGEHINEALSRSQSDRINEWKYTRDSNVKSEFVWKKVKFKNRTYLRNEIRKRLEVSKKSLDLRDIDVSNITSFFDLFAFSEISSHPHMDIEMIDITGWDTSNVTDMDSMFFNCVNLEVIFGIEELDTSSVTTTEAMFSRCNKLRKLDLSKWDPKSFKNCDNMFYGCKSLEELKGVEQWKDTFNMNNTTGYQMFKQCPEDVKPSWGK